MKGWRGGVRGAFAGVLIIALLNNGLDIPCVTSRNFNHAESMTVMANTLQASPDIQTALRVA